MEALKLNCESCSERLADFLLDELPESEAILVQEHLNLCPDCLRNYKELKGTGKALEAVPSMRAIHASPEFQNAVRKSADVELNQIVAKLPPEKRLRLEARRAARLSRKQPPLQQERPVWNAGFILAIIAGMAALAFVIFSGGRESDVRPALGKLAIANGVSQFYQRENVPNIDVKEGKTVLAGDSFSTQSTGQARFELRGSIVTLAPSSRLTFHLPAADSRGSIMLLENGEMGFEGVHDEASDKSESGIWEVHSDAGNLTLSSDAHFYLRVGKSPKDGGELLVLSGTVDVSRGGTSIAMVGAGTRVVLPGADKKIPHVETVSEPRVPAWRVGLLTAGDLSDVIHAPLRLTGRNQNGVEVQISYSATNSAHVLHDWIDAASGMPLSDKAESLALVSGIRYKHVAPFAAPLSLELTLGKDSPSDATFAFGAANSTEHGVAVDVGREAVLRINEKGRAIHSSIVAIRRNGAAPEHFKLEIVREGGAFISLLTATGAASKSLPVAQNASSGILWIEGLSDRIAFDEVKISGTLPTEWLREQLSK